MFILYQVYLDTIQKNKIGQEVLMYKILLAIFISIFILGCQGNNTAFQEQNGTVDRNVDGNVSIDTNTSVDGNSTYDEYRDYSLNDKNTPPPVPQF